MQPKTESFARLSCEPLPSRQLLMTCFPLRPLPAALTQPAEWRLPLCGVHQHLVLPHAVVVSCTLCCAVPTECMGSFRGAASGLPPSLPSILQPACQAAARPPVCPAIIAARHQLPSCSDISFNRFSGRLPEFWNGLIILGEPCKRGVHAAALSACCKTPLPALGAHLHTTHAHIRMQICSCAPGLPRAPARHGCSGGQH